MVKQHLRSLQDKIAATYMCLSARSNAERWLVSWPVIPLSGVRSIKLDNI